MSDREPYRISVPELLSGWKYVKLPDLTEKNGVFSDGDWVESKDQDPDGDVRLIQLADIGDGRFLDRSDRYLTHEKAEELNCTFLQKGDVLVARMPDPLGRACLFPDQDMTCCTVVDVCIVRTERDNLDHRWLMHTINAPQFRAAVSYFKSGTTRERISRKNLARIEFPLPPLHDQRRIVSKIEELFSNLDAGLESLKTAERQLERYRLSVLQAAVEGRLTAEWRRTHRPESADRLLERILEERWEEWEERYRRERYESKGKEPPSGWRDRYTEAVSPKLDDVMVPIPDSWNWASTDQVGRVETGSTPSTSVEEYYGGEHPFYRPGDLEDGYSTDSAEKTLTDEGMTEGRPLPAGSILVTCIGSLGKTGIIRKRGASNQQINAIIPFSSVEPEYLYFVALSPYFQNLITMRASATTTPILNKTRFTKMPVPIPAAEEQVQIVSDVERLMSLADNSLATLEMEVTRSERLRQSILREAFRGRLMGTRKGVLHRGG